MTDDALRALIAKWREPFDGYYRTQVIKRCADELEALLASAPPDPRELLELRDEMRSTAAMYRRIAENPRSSAESANRAAASSIDILADRLEAALRGVSAPRQKEGFAGLTASQQGFAGLPEHLQPTSGSVAAALRPHTEASPLTVDDIDQIIEGLDHFCIGPVENEETRAIWQPYIDKLTALKSGVAHTEEASRPFEICICAAVQMDNGVILRGHRHDDCFQTALKYGYKERITQAKQGFITSRNRFVNREEGMLLQRAAGLKSAHHPSGERELHGDMLFSEDLYSDGPVGVSAPPQPPKAENS